MYPQSVLAVWVEVPIAIGLGYLIYRKGANVMTWSIYAVLAMYVCVFLGPYLPFKMPAYRGYSAHRGLDHYPSDLCLFALRCCR